MHTPSKANNPEGCQQSQRWFLFACLGATVGPIILLIVLLPSIKQAYISDLEQAWQKNAREALIEGYSHFKAHYLNSDAAVYIYSYRLPLNLSAEDALAVLRQQIPTADKRYAVISESPTELVFRRPAYNYSEDVGFDEYRVLVDDQQKRITVMFANLDSPAEQEQHPYFTGMLYQAHQHTDMTVTFDVEDLVVYTVTSIYLGMERLGGYIFGDLLPSRRR